MSLDIRIEPPVKGNQYVFLAGRLDTQSYAQLDQRLAPLLQAPPQAYVLVLELSALDYISSAGIRSIFKARKALSPRGGKVLVVNPQPQNQQVFDLVKAVPITEIIASTADAEPYLNPMPRCCRRRHRLTSWCGSSAPVTTSAAPASVRSSRRARHCRRAAARYWW